MRMYNKNIVKILWGLLRLLFIVRFIVVVFTKQATFTEWSLFIIGNLLFEIHDNTQERGK